MGIILIVQIKEGSPRALLGGPRVFILNTKGNVVHTASTVKSPKEICIPWPLCLLAGVVSFACSGLLSVDQVVGVVAQNFHDDEGAFPRCRELVLAGCSLDQPEHKVSLLEAYRREMDRAVSGAQTPEGPSHIGSIRPAG